MFIERSTHSRSIISWHLNSLGHEDFTGDYCHRSVRMYDNMFGMLERERRVDEDTFDFVISP